MKSHEIEYKIIGSEMQIIEIVLDPDETVIAEAGAMNYMDDGISFEAKLGDGSETGGLLGKIFQAGKRILADESLFLTHFTNKSSSKKTVAFSAPYPGKIIPINLSEMANNTIICQKDAFLCAAYGTRIDIAFTRKFGTGLFGGEGFILEKLSGDGLAFIHAGGTVIRKTLNNETLKVDTGCLVAFEETIDYSIEKAGGLKSMLFGGEGLFLATLRGKGVIYLQSLPFSRLADRIIENAPVIGGEQKGEGSILGGLGRLLDGDD